MEFQPMTPSYQFMCCQEKCLHKKHEYENNKLFNRAFFTAPQKTHEQYTLFDSMITSPRILCSTQIENRGTNNVVPMDISRQPSFLVKPITPPSYKNYIQCNEKDTLCCSQHHQLFNNLTKRT